MGDRESPSRDNTSRMGSHSSKPASLPHASCPLWALLLGGLLPSPLLSTRSDSCPSMGSGLPGLHLHTLLPPPHSGCSLSSPAGCWLPESVQTDRETHVQRPGSGFGVRELAQGWVTANRDPHDNRVSSDSSLYHWAWSTQQTFTEHLLWARDPAVSKMVRALLCLAQSTAGRRQ